MADPADTSFSQRRNAGYEYFSIQTTSCTPCLRAAEKMNGTTGLRVNARYPTFLMMTHNDTISLHSLGICAWVGVPAEERAQPQRLELDLTFTPLQPLTGLRDDISGTVDYAAVAESCRRTALERPRALIETLAEDLCVALLASFPLKTITLTVRKYILTDCGAVSVTLTRPA